ncbi:MAG: carbohydrate ABC transporter permease [Spirochaetes bacterium]|nr:carbohydrate ABC transporter permease [Spirochaetota bacterium]
MTVDLDRRTSQKHRTAKFLKGTVLVYLLLALGSGIMIAPFIWMLSTSFKEAGAVFSYPPEFIPRSQIMVKYNDLEYGLFKIMINGKEEKVIKLKVFKNDADVMIYQDSRIIERTLTVSASDLKPYKKVKFLWKNYIAAWNAVPFGKFFINSIFVSICITFGQVFTSSLAAYAFARLNFKFRDQLFLGYLATLMIPSTVTMIPVFILLKMLGWIDTYQALILPGMFSAYGTFMLRQFFLSIPKDLEESAHIDGASKFTIYWNIILPLSKPALATLTTFVFMYAWNDFMWPLIVTNSMEMKTLPVGLAAFQGLYTTNWTLLMAATVIVLIPVLLVYIFNQRYFVKGIVLSGLKG